MLSRVENVAAMPVQVGVRLGSAALQVIADTAGVDVLHVKGPSVDPSLLVTTTTIDPTTGADVTRSEPRSSVDVDLLVRPGHVQRLFDAMRAHGWQLAYRFQDGSAFEHASTWLRPGLAAADIHRVFPGIGARPDAAFERLWADRRTVTIGGYPCTVPSVAAQRLILILHAARGGALDGADIRNAWGRATAEQRAELDALAADLRAQVALAAGTGRLEQHRGHREHDLWQALSTGNRSRLVLLRARVRAQPTLPGRAYVALALLTPKPGRLRHRLGREPTLGEVAAAWTHDVRAAAREARALVRRGLRGGRR